MKSKLNFRSIVFKRAYRIVKESKCEFSEALKQAWTRYRDYKNRMVTELTQRISGFDFYYFYSDDSRVYRRWTAIKEEITESLEILPNSFISAITGQLSNANNIKTFI